MSLFQRGDFLLRSGQRSGWKIECDALTIEDWQALALMASEMLPAFRSVVGVPRGGLVFAQALQSYATGADWGPVLLAEDVVTTGGSMIRYREANLAGESVIGVCAFARGKCPDWVTPLVSMTLPE